MGQEFPNHWYPADLTARAKIHSILDWHHSNLRHGSMGFVLNSTLAPAIGLPLNPQATKEAEKVLSALLSYLTARAKIHSILDWHHSNLRHGSMGFVLNSTLAPAIGLPCNPQAAKEAEKVLSALLSCIDILVELGNI
ncbi:hypothetical protein ZIOFF_006973 [Zingiber officinale]|uniref:Uncharacterized protein n=1 Tax=Zingiber officinale TaxID=94328 RepID=A0A8J5HSZ5_ZINOF|nr:hypothetical protein ZIOFF_006973 [Zingiber officinale]